MSANSLFSKISARHSVSPFNARGVVEEPAFALQNPPTNANPIGYTVRAHLTDKGWIAEAEMWAASGHLLGDGQFPNRASKPFKTRSEAVEDALSRAIRGFREQLGAQAVDPAWAKQLNALSVRVRNSIIQVRANDEGLPLRGKTFIDLCSGGMGGFGIALNQLGAKCILACEKDPEALKVYKNHVAPLATHDDVCTLVNGTKLKTDLLVMGMVCQAHSVAGKHQGMADPVLGKVHQSLLRLCSEIDAQVIIIECAQQLLTHKGGKDAVLVRDTLMRAGFRVQHRTLDASRFGVAQHRNRSFIVATRNGAASNPLLGYCFPEGTEPTAVIADILEPNLPGTIPARKIKLSTPFPQTRSPQLEKVGLIRKKSGDYDDEQGYRVYHPLGLGNTLCASSGGACPKTGAYLMPDNKARGLTPREAYRQQGMYEWTQPHPVRTQALQHAGNGVAVPLVRELARGLSAFL